MDFVVKKELCEVVEVGIVMHGVMAVVLVFEVNVLRLICGDAQLSGGCFEENSVFIMR